MKKLLCLLCATVLCVCCFQIKAIKNVYAQSETENPDEILAETAEEIGEDEIEHFERKPLYDDKYEQIGFIYDIEFNHSNGFAILLKNGNTYNVEEYFPNSKNPYKKSDYCLYLGSFEYFGITDGYLYELLSGQRVSDQKIYGVNTFVSNEAIRINYTRKEESSLYIGRGLPNYYECSYENSCGNIAGGIVCGYYDAEFEQIIPGFTAYNGSSYAAQSSQVTAVIDRLYSLMNTSANGGTTYNNFRSGLTSYLNSVGVSVSYSNLASNGKVAFSSFKSKINSNIPVVLFLDEYNIVNTLSTMSGYDIVSTNYYSGMHTMVSDGYRNINYYTTTTERVWAPVWYNPFRHITQTVETLSRTDEYLRISTGIIDITSGYLRQGDNCYIDYALSVNVY